jgi:SH3-like domain-containing protein
MSPRARYLYKRTTRFLCRTIPPGLILALIGSCTTIPLTAPIGNYYVTSEIAYLRDTSRYEGSVLGQLYKGDLVEKLEAEGSEWWRVRSGRTGQEGWMQESKLSLNPVPINYYHVSAGTVPLRECPGEECPSLQLLYRGDEVQLVEKNDRGWWRVLAIKGRGLGWLPEKALSEHVNLSQPKTSAPSYYYVAVTRLKLHQQPLYSAKVIKTLEFNDQLLKVAESPLGWLKVRQPSGGAVGWVEIRHLESLPLKFPHRQKKLKKKGPKDSESEPEIM